jgi:hypothetical protein
MGRRTEAVDEHPPSIYRRFTSSSGRSLALRRGLRSGTPPVLALRRAAGLKNRACFGPRLCMPR